MTPSPDDIWLALKSRIDTLLMIPAMAVYDPGATIPAVEGDSPDPDILVSDLRNDTVRRDIAGRININSGNLVFTIRHPIYIPATHAQLTALAARVISHFPVDTKMRYLRSRWRCRVIRQPDFLGISREGAYDMIRVRVPWSTL